MFNNENKLKQKSEKILGVFHNTISDLRKVNEQAVARIAGNAEERNKLETKLAEISSDNAECESVISSNTKIIDKINDLLG